MAKKKPKQDPADQPNFEQSLERLEQIVHLLEDGDIGLSEALQRYEEGVKILRQSYELLERAERRIELLSGVDAEGNATVRTIDDRATMAGEATNPSRGVPPDQSGDLSVDSTSIPPARDNDMDAPGGLF